MKLPRLKQIFLILILSVLFAFPPLCLASDDDPSPFAKDYITLSMTRNRPLALTSERFLPGAFMPLIGYRHLIENDWLMGFGLGFKSFNRLESNDPGIKSQTLDVFTIYHESIYSWRLFHPFYILFGPKVLYLMPSQGAHVPIVKDTTEQVEVGGALALSFVHVFSKKAFLSIGWEIWRGTKTSRLMGIEVNSGIGWSL